MSIFPHCIFVHRMRLIIFCNVAGRENAFFFAYFRVTYLTFFCKSSLHLTLSKFLYETYSTSFRSANKAHSTRRVFRTLDPCNIDSEEKGPRPTRKVPKILVPVWPNREECTVVFPKIRAEKHNCLRLVVRWTLCLYDKWSNQNVKAPRYRGDLHS